MPASAEGGTDAAVRGPVRVERVSLPDLSPAPPAPFDEQELTLLAGLDYREQDALAASTRLRAAGLDADRAAAVLTQAKLRGEAAAKFGPEAEHLLLTRPGLEQATRRAVAEHHAEPGPGSACWPWRSTRTRLPARPRTSGPSPTPGCWSATSSSWSRGS